MKLFEKVRTVGRVLLEKGLIDPLSGNISVREGHRFWVKKSKCNLGDLKQGDFVCVDLATQTMPREASLDAAVHQAVYHSIKKARVVLHAHPPFAIVLSLCENRTWPVDLEGRFCFKSIPVVPVKLKRYVEHARRRIPKAFVASGCPILMAKGHGSFCWAENTEDALKWTLALEQVCKILVLNRSLKGAK